MSASADPTTTPAPPASKERRSAPRHASRLEVKLVTRDRESLLCRVDDYCDEGIFATPLIAPKTPIGVDDELTLMPAGTDGNAFQPARVRVVRLTPESFGAIFIQPPRDFIAHLRQCASAEPEAEKPGDASNLSVDDAQAAFEEVTKRFAGDHLQALLAETLDTCAREIHEKLGYTASDKVYHSILKDLAAIQTASETVGQELVGHLLTQRPGRSHYASSRQRPPTGPFSPDGDDAGSELSLVDVHAFEHWLEAIKVANRLEQKFAPQLASIGRLADSEDGTEQPNRFAAVPFGPHHIIETLNEFSDRQGLGPIAREQLFAAAQEVLERSLGSFYDRMQTKLRESGVDLDALPPLPPPPEREPRRKTDAQTDADTVAAPAIAPDGQASAPAAGGFAALDPMTLFPPRPEHYAKLAEQTVSMLSQDPDVPRTTNAWLGALSQSMQQEMLREPAFLQQRRNPLRGLINELEHLGRLIEDGGQTEGEKRVAQAVSTIVAKAASDPRTTSDKFRTALAQVKHLTQQLSQRYQLNVERIVSNSIGRYRLKQVRKAVSETLNARYTGHLVPEIVPKLLKTCWHAYLTLDTLRGGMEQLGSGEPWETLDTLIRELGGEPYQTTDERAQRPVLMARLRKGLLETSFDPLQREQLLDELKELLLDNTDAGQAEKQQIFIPLSTTFSKIKPPVKPQAKARWIAGEKTIDTLAVGDWALLETNAGNSKQIRLVWISEDREDFTFVGQSGIRALETTRAELTQRLCAGAFKPLTRDQRSLTKRSVDHLLNRLQSQLQDRDTRDSVTGLMNRIGFQPLLEKALGAPATDDAPPAAVLCWIEIEQTRMVSTSLGFAASDHMLASVADMLLSVFDDMDADAAYLGADQFAVLLSGIALEEAHLAATRFCDAVSAQRIEWEGRKIPLCLSVGVLDLADAEGSMTTTLKLATQATRGARRGGCNKAMRANEAGPQEESEKTLESLMHLEHILENGALRLRGQKIAFTRDDDGAAHHYEVLLGILDDDGNAVDIGSFIAAAEAHRRMHLVDRWIIREAIEWAGQNPGALAALGGLAINLSGQSVTDPALVDFVRERLEDNDVPAARISFEVTETAAIARLDEARQVLLGLKALGCSSALDDFGTGLSSFEFLRELPVDYLKIDGSFVKGIANNPNDYAVVRSINEIGHFMGKRTIAEYVTDDAVLRCIDEIGVDLVQGFGIETPKSLDELRFTVREAPEA
jgi:diguanylate cyclase (GGDEF)-like protein